jgi:hypothetical protein
VVGGRHRGVRIDQVALHEPLAQRAGVAELLGVVLGVPRVHEGADELELTGCGIRRHMKPSFAFDRLANWR